jgi:hypothetical protein
MALEKADIEMKRVKRDAQDASRLIYFQLFYHAVAGGLRGVVDGYTKKQGSSSGFVRDHFLGIPDAISGPVDLHMLLVGKEPGCIWLYAIR